MVLLEPSWRIFTKALQHSSDAPDNHVALGIYEHPLTRPADNRPSAPGTQGWRQNSKGVFCSTGLLAGFRQHAQNNAW